MEKLVNIKINGQAVSVPQGTTILDAARSAGIRIPTLCYLRDINAIGACRVCVVEVKGARSLVAACVYPVSEGMEVITNSKRVLDARKTTVELLLSDHDKKCTSCVRSGNCELQTLANELGCEDGKYKGAENSYEVDVTPSIIRDNNKCILCKRCVAACKEYQSVSVIGANARGFATRIDCAFEMPLAASSCVNCGQCVNVCPTGALREREEIDDVLAAIADPDKYVIMAPAPAVRVAIGEEFGYPIGSNQQGKMITAMRKLGVDEVDDVNFAADLTIMEEGTEFINRLSNYGKLPLITSCSPGWIKFIEHNFPEFLGNLSTCKSPQQMFGAIAKSYYAEKLNRDPKDIYVVTIMPCTAKKFEKLRPEMSVNGIPDIDAVLTTRELARLIKRQGIQFNSLEDGEFDAPLGMHSGAGLIFGASGGVMEAALRTVVEKVGGQPLEKLEFTEVRGMQGIKEASYIVAGKEVRVAVASGLKNARALMEALRDGKVSYHFVEIMACPGGCINGGGQPIVSADIRNNVDYRALRAQAIYDGDQSMGLRKSHENPCIQELYATYLGEPNSHRAHELLHTVYTKRPLD